jgi:hypothetical protein
MVKQLSEQELLVLRQNGIIRETEVAYYAGDLIYAEDIITSTRRQLQLTQVESFVRTQKQLLKG